MRFTNLLSVVFLLMASSSCGADVPPPVVAPLSSRTPPAPLEKADEPPKARADGRLPSFAHPTGYALNLSVDPAKERFTGTATIRTEVTEKTFHLVMHARDIRVTSAIAKAGGAAYPAATTLRLAHGGQVPDELVLTFEKPLLPGPVTLEIAYEAPFSLDLSGLYRLKEQERWYAFTQFEATDARRAFPCFDEPGFKTTFDVTLSVPKGMIAVANAPEVSRKDEGEKTTFVFDQTQPLPSYLVAFAVGDLEIRQGPKAPIPIRLISAKGKSALGGMAIDATAALVDKLGEYFDYKYPYAKLDIVAVPDFAAGAMENPGLITFREELLLLDPAHASSASRRGQAMVIAHELAHQWFGDLVTMQWWNDLWLNEGFATWMESRVVDRWQPAFGAEIEQVSDAQHVMDTDALSSARAVRQPVTSTAEASEAFDGITYEKGGAVLGMIEHWIGKDAFQKGVRAYIKDNAFKNAKAEDLLTALGRASGKDVSAMAATFLDRPGVPNVAAQLSCEQGGRWNVELRQEPWMPLGAKLDPANSDQTWTTPVCVLAEGRTEPLCTELTTAGPSLVAGRGKCPAWIHPNADQAGYYRFNQPLPGFSALAKASPQLDVRNRIGIVSNLWAQVRAGTMGADAALRILPTFDRETNRHVIEQVLETLNGMSDALVDDAARPAFRAYVMARLGAQKRKLGWTDLPVTTKPGAAASAASGAKVEELSAAEERALLRKGVLLAMGELAEDAATLKEAEPFTARWLKDPTSVDGDLAQVAVELSAHNATPALLDELRAAARQAKTPQDRVIALRGMAAIDDKALLRRALDLMLTDEVKVQDMRYFFRTALSRRSSRPVVYEWVKSHWDGLRAKLPGPLGSRLVGIAGSLCTKFDRDDADAFFTPRAKAIEGATRPLAESLESAGICAELREKGSGAVSKYFKK